MAGLLALTDDVLAEILARIVVCDPLFRRFVLLPPIPDDLAASVENPYLQRGGDGGLQSRSSEIFLASCGSDAGGEELSFAVIWLACCRGKLVAFFFSDQWQLQSRIILPEEWGYRFRGIIGASEGYLFIKLDHPKQNLGDPVEQNVAYFTFDIKTMQLGRTIGSFGSKRIVMA
ncbi:hypothetical protein E2562_029180 [Oryza meyeriana var. granulata]|uniref:Uncharacterized protein n=1 Tax=Oryza meyeriana var. granulata TaxID=110450 RepID=A0A6G1C107_9ORYZ|nr:hypothetical protein E2562_029180 [Oryza meyeriana var. granulata]